MSSKKKIPGFDEITRQPVERTRAEWQALIAKTIAAGGRRRFEKGETFIHGRDALLIAEIFANVPAPEQAGSGKDVSAVSGRTRKQR